MNTHSGPVKAEFIEVLLHGPGSRLGHMQLAIIADLSKNIPAEKLAAAIRGMIAVFPVLGCCYRPGFWRDHWTACPEFPLERALTVIRADNDIDAQSRRYISQPIDPEAGWPFRVILLCHEGGCRLILTFLHLVCDAHGGLAMLAELAAQLAGTGSAGPRPMNRSFYQLGRSVRFKDLPALAGELLDYGAALARFMVMKDWSSTVRKARQRQGRLLYRSIHLAGSGYENFTAACRRAGATINDGLLAAGLLVCAGRSSDPCIGLSYTINLRRHIASADAIIANMSSIIPVVMKRRTGEPPASLLRRVAGLTSLHKAGRPGRGPTLLPALLLGWMPAGMLRRLGRGMFSRMITDFVKYLVPVTNIGSLDYCVRGLGDSLRDITMVGPFQNGYPAPMTMATGFRGTLTVNVCAADNIEPEAVEELAREWEEALEVLSTVPHNK